MSMPVSLDALFRRQVISLFLALGALEDVAKRNVEARIHITNHNVFEAIKEVALNKEEQEKAYLAVLAQITAEEMANREALSMI